MSRLLKKHQTDKRIYVLNMSAAEKRKSARRNLIYVVVLLILQFLAGMVNQESSRTAWIVFPYIAIYLPIGYALLGVYTDWGAANRMSSTQYQEGIMRVRKSLMAVFVLVILGIVLEMIYLIIHHSGLRLMPELIYVLLHVLQMICVISYGRYYGQTFTDVRVEEQK